MSLRRVLKVEEALGYLAQAADVGIGEKNWLIMLLDYLQLAGMIAIENGEVRAIKSSGQQSAYEQTEAQSADVETQQAPPSTPPPTRFRAQRDTDTALHFQARGVRVEVEYDEEEIANWSESRIIGFFAGIAQAVSQATRNSTMVE